MKNKNTIKGQRIKDVCPAIRGPMQEDAIEFGIINLRYREDEHGITTFSK